MSDVSINITVNFNMTEPNTRLARTMLEAAVQLDPSATDAAVWLADLTLSDYLNGWNGAGSKELQDASFYLAPALAVANPTKMAHYTQGFLHRANGNHTSSRDSFRAARTLDPNFDRAWAHEGAQEVNRGHWALGRQRVDTAIGLNPPDGYLGLFYWIKGRSYFFEAANGGPGTFGDAIQWLEESRKKRSNLWYNWLYLIAAYQITNTGDPANQLVFFKAAHPEIATLNDLQNLEAKNPNSNNAVTTGRQAFMNAIAAIW